MVINQVKYYPCQQTLPAEIICAVEFGSTEDGKLAPLGDESG